MKGVLGLLRSKNLMVISLTVSLMVAAWGIWGYLLPLHLRDLGATDSQIGLSFTISNASYALTLFLGGLLADRVGRKPLIVVPTFLFIPLYAGAAIASHWYEVVTFLVIAGALGAIQWPAFFALIAESVPEDKTGKAFGVFEFLAGAGFVAGAFAGSWLVKIAGPGLLILSSALASTICGPLRALFLEESPGFKRPEVRISLSDLIPYLSIPTLIAVVAINGVNYLSLWGPFISLHAEDFWGWSRPYINQVMALGRIISTLSSFFGGYVTDRYGASGIMALSAALHAFTLLTIAYMKPSTLFWFLLLIFFIAAQVSWVSYDTFISKLAPSEHRGRVLGTLETMAGLMGSAAPALGGIARENIGSAGPFWLTAFLASVLILTLKIPLPPRKVKLKL